MLGFSSSHLLRSTPYFLLLLARSAFAEPLSADAAVSLGMSRHPLVVEAEARIVSAEGEVRSATFLRENPEISGRFAPDSSTGEAGLNQPLSLTGEGVFARQAALARREAADATSRRARLAAAADIRHAWVEAVVATQEARLAQGALDLASRRVAAAEARVLAGDAPDLDARLVRLGRAQAAESYLLARRGEAAALARLATLVGRTLEPDDLPDDPLGGAPSGEGVSSDRSDVLAARHLVDAAEATLREERAAVLPAFGVGAFVEQAGQERFVGPSLTVTLPLWQQNAGGRARSRADLAVARADAERLALQAQAERLATASVTSDAARVLQTLGTTLEGDAAAALGIVEAGYQSGEIDLPTVIFLQDEVLSSRRALLTAHAASADATIDHLLAIEDLRLFGVQP